MTVSSSKSKPQKPKAKAKKSVAAKVSAEIEAGAEETPVEPPVEEKVPDVAEGTETEVKGGDTVTLSKEDLLSLVNDAVSKEVGKIKTADAVANGRQPVLSLEDIDKNDYLESPIVFFAYSVYFSIHDDVQQNTTIMPPYLKPIRFKLYQRYTRGQGIREKEVISISCVQVQSKKIIEFLRNHSLFGIRFFEDVNEAKAVDVTRAEKMTEVILHLAKLSHHQIIERAKREREEGESISLSADVKYVRKQLAQLIVDKEMKRMHELREESLNKGTKANPATIEDQS